VQKNEGYFLSTTYGSGIIAIDLVQPVRQGFSKGCKPGIFGRALKMVFRSAHVVEEAAWNLESNLEHQHDWFRIKNCKSQFIFYS